MGIKHTSVTSPIGPSRASQSRDAGCLRNAQEHAGSRSSKPSCICAISSSSVDSWLSSCSLAAAVLCLGSELRRSAVAAANQQANSSALVLLSTVFASLPWL
ncbi:hypothetical protein N657DRAFT_642260 [Parathielavia appendiculata]|uniref:Uncharacterized protein n=1 Tax=Parathielavia appendiculata TaxID=2587402 RepID=A0AAN6U3Y9_9PEZI|nr:hypothetical protein N657DRAFT_642260 [Parathielavia appendiculata]